MSYYRPPMGDYRTGGYGYPTGDPGLFSFIGKALKTVWKVAKPLILGPQAQVVGAIATGTALGTLAAGQPPPPPAMPGGAIPGAPGVPAISAIGVRCPRPIIPLLAGGTCPVGYHPRKSDGAVCVRNRRMNVANPRALRKSMRRVQGFERLAKKTIRFTKRVKMRKRTCA